MAAMSLGANAFLSFVLFIVSFYCLRSAHLLWGRVDFTSLLIRVEMRGSFEEAHINIDNQMTSAMSSGKKVINIESMTLRVWAAELDTVIFDKDGVRDLIGMRGRPDVAGFYADHLGFAGRIASVVAPSASTDVERISRIAQTQQKLGSQQVPVFSAPQIPATAPTAAVTQVQPVTHLTRRCSNDACGREAPSGAAFCSYCGTRLSPA
jgi:hypothetical protein